MVKTPLPTCFLMVSSLFLVCLDGCDLASGVVLPHDS